MRNIKRVFALTFIAVFLTCAIAAPAFAGPAGGGANYDGRTGSSVNFNKYLVMGAGDRTPAATFSYTIQAGSAIPASAGKMAVLAGVGQPTVSNSVFTSDQATSTTATDAQIDVQRTDRTNVKWESAQGEKFAVSTSTVDFTGVTFTEPGVYRYIITETASETDTARGLIHDDDVDRVLDVYVTDNGSGVLVVSSYAIHKNVGDVVVGTEYGSADVEAAGDALPDKTDGFTNEYKTKDLVFKKEVTGNQASHDKYFKFTVRATNVADTDVFTVSIASDDNANTTDGSASATSGSNEATVAANAGQTNATQVTGAQLKAGVNYYLMHGQWVAVRGLPIDSTYTVTEDAEDYKSTASVVTGHTDPTTGVIGTVAGTNKVVHTSYQNQRNGVIPTGILMTIIPYAAILLLGVGAIVFFLVSKRRGHDDNE